MIFFRIQHVQLTRRISSCFAERRLRPREETVSALLVPFCQAHYHSRDWLRDGERWLESMSVVRRTGRGFGDFDRTMNQSYGGPSGADKAVAAFYSFRQEFLIKPKKGAVLEIKSSNTSE